MKPKFLLLQFASLTDDEYAAVKNVLDAAEEYIPDWLAYMRVSFILVTTLSASDVSNFFHDKWPTKWMFVCKVDLSERQGFLGQVAWDWLGKYDGTGLTATPTDDF